MFHMAHNKAQAPTQICTLSFFDTPTSQFSNKFAILVGRIILKVMCTIRHTIFAKGQKMKRCWTVSFWSQKQYFWLSCHFLLAKLSFVNKTFLRRNHIKILIFSGTLIFHKCFCKYFVLYMDLTVYKPDFLVPIWTRPNEMLAEPSSIVYINVAIYSPYVPSRLA
jgi:hypothetical protein